MRVDPTHIPEFLERLSHLRLRFQVLKLMAQQYSPSSSSPAPSPAEVTQNLQAEVLRLQQLLAQAQAQVPAPSPPSPPIPLVTPSKAKEPKVSLPAKFDSTRSKCRGFLTQVGLIFTLQPDRYPDAISKVAFVGTLLDGTALTWYAPLVERNDPVLHDYNMFIQEFKACFGDTDSVRLAINKIRQLRQGNRPASQYAAEFRLLACDIPWDEQALMEEFHRHLRDDVKDLMIAQPDPTDLSSAITLAVRYDN